MSLFDHCQHCPHAPSPDTAASLLNEATVEQNERLWANISRQARIIEAQKEHIKALEQSETFMAQNAVLEAGTDKSRLEDIDKRIDAARAALSEVENG
jgi:hypothetical protein